MDIKPQLLYQPQIVPYQPLLVNTVVFNGAVNDSAEINLFPCRLSEITVPKISGRGQDPVGGRYPFVSCFDQIPVLQSDGGPEMNAGSSAYLQPHP